MGKSLTGSSIQEPVNGPIYWVSRWIDYSDAYGLGYQLNDGRMGVAFIDLTRLILDSDKK